MHKRRLTLAEELAPKRKPASYVPPAERRRQRQRDRLWLASELQAGPFTAVCRDGMPMSEAEQREAAIWHERLRPRRVLKCVQRLRSTRSPVAPVRQVPRRACEGRRRPGARRVVSRSAGGGSSGDPDEPEPASGRHQRHLDRLLAGAR
jgi:hypothetical protein